MLLAALKQPVLNTVGIKSLGIKGERSLWLIFFLSILIVTAVGGTSSSQLSFLLPCNFHGADIGLNLSHDSSSKSGIAYTFLHTASERCHVTFQFNLPTMSCT